MKRGISPLLSAVILIGLAISVLTYIFFFSTSFFQSESIKTGEESEKRLAVLRDDVKIYVDSVNFGDGDAVTDDVELRIENLGAAKITGFKFIVHGSNGNQIIDKDFIIENFDKELITFSYNSASVGEVEKIEIIPEAILVISSGELEPDYIPEAKLFVRGTSVLNSVGDGDVGTICGDSSCEIGETCSNCPTDCGTCATCNDFIKNHDESDVDCGGICNSCVNGKICLINSDCQSNNCVSGICASLLLPNGAACSSGNECTSGNCYSNTDADADGYPAPTGKICQATAGNADDCYDNNANAHPEQTTYYISNRGDGSWDYNCDGFETKSPRLNCLSTLSTTSPRCTSIMPTGHPGFQTSIPDCGGGSSPTWVCMSSGSSGCSGAIGRTSCTDICISSGKIRWFVRANNNWMKCR